MRKDDPIASLIRKYMPIMNSEVPDINVPVLKPVPAPRPAPPNFTSIMKSAVKKAALGGKTALKPHKQHLSTIAEEPSRVEMLKKK